MTDPLTLEVLKCSDLSLTAPFSLQAPGLDSMVCEAIYRHLPGRRVVFSTHWGGAHVLVKLFFRRKDFDRERSGLQAMQNAGVPCPGEVWILRDGSGKSGDFLATAFLEGAVSLRQLYVSQPREAMPTLLSDAVAMIGRLHRAGVMQADIHLDNFLSREGSLFMIDGGGIQPLKKPLHNLAMFFAQMVPEYDQLMPEVIQAYGVGAPEPEQLQPLIARMREKRIRHYLAKTIRDCTQFQRLKVRGAFVVMARQRVTDKLLQVITQPEVAVGQATFLKRGNTATVMKLSGDSSSWVLKRYNIKDLWHGLGRALRRSRAWISWQNAHRLELLGIATPRPLAMRENRAGPFRQGAYLVTEWTSGESLQAWLLRYGPAGIPDWLDREVSRLFAIMWLGRVSHGDMKATNLIVCGEQLQLIDLDALRRHRCKRFFKAAYGKDLQRFMDNWQGKTWQHFEQLLRPYASQCGIKLINKKV
ncbi:lipopolysaccharide kinase InaA family protein [Porticoccus hydrocarbonoclasticus]|uniref:lipopolysaccharide kinase InaA family protein n=1 Tax=Porticoccus hydrocarbonoclasticus TaxID=1073414 RepID=UPI00056A26E7|nr:lipopolysaccharide kinase InaA family protein [Porticoccus hydrocarbonoclasticus]